MGPSIACLDTTICAWTTLCAKIWLTCSPDSWPTLISLIWSNLAEILPFVFKNIVRIHTNLCSWVICAQITPACSPDSIDTFISQIQPNMAIIWAHVHKKIACLHASLCTLVILCVQKWPQCSMSLFTSTWGILLWTMNIRLS